MFENIIGQQSVVGRLSTEVTAAILPPSLLFHGPDYSGKGSTALELARVLTCTGSDPTVPWGCSCRSCVQQRHLLQPETLLLGGRYFSREIAVACAAVKRDRRPPLRFLLERAVRKLARRFDPLLWEGEQARIRKVEPMLAELDELLAPYLPESQLPSESRFVKGLDSIGVVCAKIEAAQPLDAVPVHVIRRLSQWAHLAPNGRAKVAVIENVDRLHDSARNALLKTLEEPPREAWFVLTTRRRGAVIQTIISRSRAYGFATRGAEESAEVIERIFRDVPGNNPSIRDYFVSIDGRGLRPLAERFLETCLSGDEIELGLLDEIERAMASLGAGDGFRYFVEELSDLMRVLLRAGKGVTPRVLTAWNSELGRASSRVEAYNIAPARALEGLFYHMRQTA